MIFNILLLVCLVATQSQFISQNNGQFISENNGHGGPLSFETAAAAASSSPSQEKKESILEKATSLYAVPVHRDSYKPLHNIKASYQSNAIPSNTNNLHLLGKRSNEKDLKHVQEANFFINSTIPSINLDNFPYITNVHCQSNNKSVTLTFADQVHTIQAHQEWSQLNPRNFSLFMNHHHACFGSSQLSALHVEAVKKGPLVNQLVLDTRALNHTQVYGSFEVYMGRIPIQSSHQYQLNTLRKRSLLKRDDAEARNRTTFYEFGLNYYDGKIINNNFTLVNFSHNVILQFPRISAYCINCHTRGNLSFDVYLKTSFARVVDYKIRSSGHFHLQNDYDFHFPKSSDKRLVSYGAFYFNLGPALYVPGLFLFGASFGFGGSFTYAATQKFWLQMGFEVNHNYDVLIEPDRSRKTLVENIFHLPQVTHLAGGNKEPFFQHHRFNISNTTDLTYSLHTAPIIDMTLAALEIDIVSLKLSYDTALGVQTRTGKAMFCNNTARDFGMVKRAAFNFDIKAMGYSASIFGIGLSWAGFALFRKHFEIWATPYVSVDCEFCATAEKCPPGTLNLNRTVGKDGGLDNFS